MFSSARPANPRHHDAWPVLIATAIAGAYALGHFLWFASTPLGRVPVLDARESIAFANSIIAGQVPAEPFYRAPGYALILVALRLVGVGPGALFTAGLLLGVVFHAANAALAASLARTWFGHAAAIVAGLLYALNPVLVHFAVQAGDTTPAITCFLAGLRCLASAEEPEGQAKWRRWLGASVWWALATALRPNYLLVWLLVPVLGAVHGRTAKTCAAALAGALVFVALGTWQWRVSGRFGFLPAQGAYNLWAANAPGYHGRFYTQKLVLPADLAATNPARAESLLLYQHETGEPAATLDAANAYWRARFLDYAMHHPVAWIAQLGRKAYALLNDWEQYNNETPAFHLRRSPWLRWNPIGWGFVLVFGVVGAARLGRERPSLAVVVTLIATVLAASVLLFFVSARFRLPLAALLTPLAAGGVTGLSDLFALSRRYRWAVATACGLTALIAYSHWDGVRDTATFVQDHALLARAAATVGDDTLAWHEAEAALALRPDQPDALRLAVSSYFNLLIAGNEPPSDEPRWRAYCVRFLRSGIADPDLRTVALLSCWRAGDRAFAQREWRLMPNCPSAIAARVLSGDATANVHNLALAADAPPLVEMAVGSGAYTRVVHRLFTSTAPP